MLRVKHVRSWWKKGLYVFILRCVLVVSDVSGTERMKWFNHTRSHDRCFHTHLFCSLDRRLAHKDVLLTSSENWLVADWWWIYSHDVCSDLRMRWCVESSKGVFTVSLGFIKCAMIALSCCWCVLRVCIKTESCWNLLLISQQMCLSWAARLFRMRRHHCRRVALDADLFLNGLVIYSIILRLSSTILWQNSCFGCLMMQMLFSCFVAMCKRLVTADESDWISCLSIKVFRADDVNSCLLQLNFLKRNSLEMQWQQILPNTCEVNSAHLRPP